jgi:hypothetical protein
MNKVVFGFIVVIVVFLFVVLNYNTSAQIMPASAKTNIIKKINTKSKQERNAKIVYKDTKNEKITSKTSTKKTFSNIPKNKIKNFHTISSKKVDGYTVSIKTPQKPKEDKFSPPQFPTLIKGEINGQRFNLIIDTNAKKQDAVLSISTKDGPPAVINLDSIKDARPGQTIDIGNIITPDNITQNNVANFEKQAQNTIDNNTQASKNTQNDSVAPPVPPAL